LKSGFYSGAIHSNETIYEKCGPVAPP
jgi:hypothetical protein